MTNPDSQASKEPEHRGARTRHSNFDQSYGPFPDSQGAFGVTFDGHNIWAATGRELIAVSPTTEEVLDRIPVPADAGTAFDGTYLYQIGDEKIRKIDPNTHEIIHTIPAPEGHGSGMAWAEGSLWVGHYSEKKIRRINPETGKILATLHSNRFVTGISWIEEELWHGVSDDNGTELRQIHPETGEVIERIMTPRDTMIAGVESNGSGTFFCGGGNDGKIRTVQKHVKENHP